MSDTYTWCEFKKGNSKTSGYIPSKAAKVGNKVELLSLDGEFWTVVSAAKETVSKEFVRKHEKAFEAFSYGHGNKKSGLK